MVPGLLFLEQEPVEVPSFIDLFKAALKLHVENIDNYCLHSLRAGVASPATNNGINFNDRLFKLHGR